MTKKPNIEKQWTTEAGLVAIVLITDLGHRCGYVGVDKDHPLFGVEYSESSPAVVNLPQDEQVGKRGVMSMLFQAGEEQWRLDAVFDVHGSLTYSGESDRLGEGLWWFGFDAGHYGDAPDLSKIENPRMRQAMGRMGTGTIRSLRYMADECESLARQLIDRCDLSQAKKLIDDCDRQT